MKHSCVSCMNKEALNVNMAHSHDVVVWARLGGLSDIMF